MATNEPKPKIISITTVATFFIIMLIVYYVTNIKPQKEYVKKETQSILDTAHKQAEQFATDADIVAFYTDTDYYTRHIDTKTAKEDSAYYAKKIQALVSEMSSIPYYINPQDNSFNLNNAMKDPKFAVLCDRYKHAITQLKLGRLQRETTRWVTTQWTLQTNGIIK